MSLKTTIENYQYAEKMHQDIDDEFNSLDQNENVTPPKIAKMLADVHRLEIALNKITIKDLKEKYSPEVVEDIEHNVDFFYEGADYIKRRLLGIKYYDLIIGPMYHYINKVYYGTGDKKDLSRKFAAMLTHPNNIMTFMNYIKRMAVGTMSDSEFKKIYTSNKNKMLGGTKAFESFSNYTLNISL